MGRLDQAGAKQAPLLAIAHPAARRQQYQRQRHVLGPGADDPRQHHAIHLRHHVIENRRIDRRRLRQARQRFHATAHRLGDAAPRMQLALQNFPVHRVVINHQHALGRTVPGRHLRLRQHRLWRAIHGNIKTKQRAAIWPVFSTDAPAHQGDQAFADRQTQTGAAVFARNRGIDLGERGKQAGDAVRRNADAGITHPKLNPRRPGCGLGFEQMAAHHDFALGGELDGVADQIGEYLADSRHVPAHHRRHIVVDAAEQLQAFAARVRCAQINRLFRHPGERQRLVLQLQMARFDFGEIENVVDQGQQHRR